MQLISKEQPVTRESIRGMRESDLSHVSLSEARVSVSDLSHVSLSEARMSVSEEHVTAVHLLLIVCLCEAEFPSDVNQKSKQEADVKVYSSTELDIWDVHKNVRPHSPH